MSLLTDTYDIKDNDVAVEHLISILHKAATSTYSEALPVVNDFVRKIGKPINPMKRANLTHQSVVVTIMPKSSESAVIDFLTMLPNHREWSSITFTWFTSTDRRPTVCTNWDQLISAHNHHKGPNKYFYAIPQDMFRPLYDAFHNYRRNV